MAHSIIHDLFDFNAWANRRLLELSRTLSDVKLDEPLEMGFGSLRNTFFHILAAEEIWLERWENQPRRPFQVDAGSTSLTEIGDRLEQASISRKKVIDQHEPSNWSHVITYQDIQGNLHSRPLKPLLLHVANHGIHHRAQVLFHLKRNHIIVPGGMDYLFYRFAFPTTEQDTTTTDSMRHFGIEVGSGQGAEVQYDSDLVGNYFAYGDWCNDKLLSLSSKLADNDLDADMGMGMGSLRKTMLHILDAERWWMRNWTEGPAEYSHSSISTKVSEVVSSWQQLRTQRQQFLANLSSQEVHRVLNVPIGPMQVRVDLIESLIQLCGHGTHHRAQWLNMLRRSGIQPPAIDIVVWLREIQGAV